MRTKHSIHLKGGAVIRFRADNVKLTYQGDELLRWKIENPAGNFPMYLRIDEVIAVTRGW